MNRDARNALIRAHQNNIDRYCRILATHLADHEREYVHRRIVEERLELERLLKSGKPGRREIDSTATRTIIRQPDRAREAEVSAG